jgi:hypothetical protein
MELVKIRRRNVLRACASSGPLVGYDREAGVEPEDLGAIEDLARPISETVGALDNPKH